jgi:hypothetical protein
MEEVYVTYHQNFYPNSVINVFKSKVALKKWLDKEGFSFKLDFSDKWGGYFDEYGLEIFIEIRPLITSNEVTSKIVNDKFYKKFLNYKI